MQRFYVQTVEAERVNMTNIYALLMHYWRHSGMKMISCYKTTCKNNLSGPQIHCIVLVFFT